MSCMWESKNLKVCSEPKARSPQIIDLRRIPGLDERPKIFYQVGLGLDSLGVDSFAIL